MEPPRADAPPRRCDNGATCAARAAEGDAGDRFSQRQLARPVCTVCGRVPSGTERNRLCRGTKPGHRIPWAEGHYDRLAALAADLVGRKVEVIIAMGGDLASRAAKDATSTIPIVFSVGGDPIELGLVASLARPGGNLTGVTVFVAELVPKRLELLSELVPKARVFALLVNPNNPNTERIIRDVQEAARLKGVQLPILKASTESEIDTAFASLVQLQAGALVVHDDPFLINSRLDQLVALAVHHAVPAISGSREMAASGGLISYGASRTALYRQVGIYVGKILKGAKPADLPVQQPTRFELVVNLNTAKALGLIIPPSILARADEVIE
ncbi:MAG: ABC transporter substrate-binding protein [Alphaproteobacteria bacterium]|nr:MAG: ABC transporter substrate-binding protein [Alphaproteobacteria bacterium]